MILTLTFLLVIWLSMWQLSQIELRNTLLRIKEEDWSRTLLSQIDCVTRLMTKQCLASAKEVQERLNKLRSLLPQMVKEAAEDRVLVFQNRFMELIKPDNDYAYQQDIYRQSSSSRKWEELLRQW